MLESDPKMEILSLVETEWTTGNTILGGAPSFQTGWYSFGSSDAQVSFTNPEESPVNDGNTGVTAGTGSGGVAKVNAGTLLINCWSGTRDDMRDAGVNGEKVNPKSAARSMAREVTRILGEHHTITTQEGDTYVVGGGAVRELVDTEPKDAVYRYEVTAHYRYAENYPNST